MRISDWSSDVCSSDLMDVDNRLHRVAVGKFDIVKETAAQESVGQFFFIVRCDDDDWAVRRGDCLVGLVNVERHAIELLEQIDRKFDVGLVDLVDQQTGQLGTGENLPQLTLADIVADVVASPLPDLAV